MCIGCAAGAMTAVAGASGIRLWVEARFPWLMGARTKKVVRRTIVGIGLLLAGLLGGSGAAPTSATARTSDGVGRPALVAPVAVPAVAPSPPRPR